MGLFSKRTAKQNSLKPEGGKIYKIINSCAIVGLFVAVGIFVLMITGTIEWSSAMVGFTLAIAIICFCCLLALPWVRKLEQGDFKIMAYVFLGLVALCCILWVIADIVVIKQYRAIKYALNNDITSEESEKFAKGLLKALNYLKFTTFVTIQFSVASFIASVILKLRKTLIPFQAIAYASYAVCDFWISGLMLSIKINADVSFSDGSMKFGDVFSANESFIKFLVSRAMLTVLLLAIAYVVISNVVIKKQEQRRMKNAAEDLTFDNTTVKTQEQAVETKVETPEEKLASLKKMYDSELITKEEYETKKSEILKDM